MEPAYAQLMERETFEWNALVNLLRIEQTALQQGDISNLAQISNSKLDLVRSLDRMVEEREKWQSQNPQQNAAAPSLETLLELREAARTLNQQNGTLIDRRLHAVRKAVDILLGSASKQNVYTQDGQMTARSSYQPLSAA
ncbi:MAG: flagellar protein FlgN [Thiobacillaceae bacterium]|jgi:flagellar biosynthesis/type III secretory pathway chaperone